MLKLLEEVLKLPDYKHFKKIAKDDYRDSTIENAPLSISSKGWANHSTGEDGSLQSLINPKVDPSKLYDNATLETTDLEIIREYYKNRSIEISDFVITSTGMRINRYKDKMYIVTPLFNKDNKIIQLHRIELDQQYQKATPSRLAGRADEDRAIMLRKGMNKVMIVEGLEDGIIIFQLLKNYDVCISGGTKGFKKLELLVKDYQLKYALLDHDIEDQGLKFSYYLGKDVQRLIHPDIGIDANNALDEGWFEEWFEELKEVTFAEAVECYDITGNTKARDILEEMNKKHAIVKVQGKVVIMNDEFDPMFDRQQITLSAKVDFLTWYSNQFVSIENSKGESKVKNVGRYWLDSKDRRQYEGFALDPSNEISSDYFNLWRGFAYEPSNKGSCQIYYDHILENIACNSDIIANYILDWMADAVQFPKNKHGVSLVLRGGSGVGKGAMIYNFCKLYGIGQHAIHVSSADKVAGNFNAHLKDCLILFADEAFFAGDVKHESTLKTLITEEVKFITFKGKDSFQFPNYMRLMMSSNKGWVAPLEKDDRRFFITDVGDGRQKDHKFWNKFFKEFEKESTYQKLLFDLLNRDITKSNLKNYPQTAAIIDNKVQSMNSVEQWIYDKLYHSELNGELNIDAMYEDYKNSCGKSWSMSKNGYCRKLVKTFNSDNPTIPNLLTRFQKMHEGGRYYKFNTMKELRTRFDSIFKTQFVWPNTNDEILNNEKEVIF